MIVGPQLLSPRVEHVNEDPVVTVDVGVWRDVEPVPELHRAADRHAVALDRERWGRHRRIVGLVPAAPGRHQRHQDAEPEGTELMRGTHGEYWSVHAERGSYCSCSG